MTASEGTLPGAVQAFDAIAGEFDARFGDWLSVAAQRRAVRRWLMHEFPIGARLLELGGGTGEDALYLAEHGRNVLLTDGSPAMLARAAHKARIAGVSEMLTTQRLVLEETQAFADERVRTGAPRFDGVFSNFAALNCVADLASVGSGLARILRPGARAILVVFGPFSMGEVFVELARGNVRNAFRRFGRGNVPARLSGHEFVVRYPSPREIARALGPLFRLERVRGIGVFVPPSAAEPQISSLPRVVRALELLDRAASRPLALLGDHVLVELERTAS